MRRTSIEEQTLARGHARRHKVAVGFGLPPPVPGTIATGAPVAESNAFICAPPLAALKVVVIFTDIAIRRQRFITLLREGATILLKIMFVADAEVATYLNKFLLVGPIKTTCLGLSTVCKSISFWTTKTFSRGDAILTKTEK